MKLCTLIFHLLCNLLCVTGSTIHIRFETNKQKKNVILQLRASRLREHRHLVLLLIQDCQVQKLSGNALGKLKQKEATLFVKFKAGEKTF